VTIDELVPLVRASRLDDSSAPYRWSDATLVAHFNESEREACRRADLIIDKKTDTYCRIALVAGNSRYTVSTKVRRILAADLGAKTRGTLVWTASTKTLSDALGRFVTSGFVAGDQVYISGFTNAANNGIFTISAVVAGSIVVEEDVTLVNETATDVIITVKKKELQKITSFTLDNEYPGWNSQSGEPMAYLEEENNELIVVPIPEDPNVLSLTVVRLPAADMTLLASPSNVSPEIPAEYHLDLMDWVCHLAYLIDDNDTQDLNKAKLYEDSFTQKFGPRPSARMERIRKRYPRELKARPQTFGY
jgi:hypothetical protein